MNTNKQPPYQPIIFTSKDEEGVSYPYYDPMLIVPNIDNFTVKRILVNSGSSCNVLTWEAVVVLQVDLEKLKKITTP